MNHPQNNGSGNGPQGANNPNAAQSQAQYRQHMAAQQQAALAAAQQRQQSGPSQGQQNVRPVGQPTGSDGAGGGSGAAAAVAGNGGLNPAFLAMLAQNPQQLASFYASVRANGQITEEQMASLQNYVRTQQQQLAANGASQVRPPAAQQGMVRPPQPAQNPQQQQQAQQPRQQPTGGQNRPPTQQSTSVGGASMSRPPSNGPQITFTPEQQNMIGQIYRAVESVGKKMKDLEARAQSSQDAQEREALQKSFKEEQVNYNSLVGKLLACKEQYVKQQTAQMAGCGSPGPSGASSSASSAQQPQQSQAGGQPQRLPASNQPQRQQQSARPSPAPGTPGGASTPGGTGFLANQQQQQQQQAAGGTSGIAPGSTASSMLVNQSRIDPSTSSPAPSSATTSGAQDIRANPSQSSANAYSSSAVPGQATISSNLPPQIPQPFPNSQGPRPTLSMGLAGGPGSATTSTPGILAHPTNNNNGLSNLFALGAVASEASRAGGVSSPNAGAGGTNGVSANPSLSSTSSNAMMTAALGEKNGRMLTKRKIQELVGELDMEEVLDEDVEDLLLEIADEFIDSVTHFACRLAKHRKGDKLEARDVQLHLERAWNIRIPNNSMPIPPVRVRGGATAGPGGGVAGKGV